jgi:hypothetical protein
VTDQFTRQFIDVATSEVIDPLAPKVENGRAQHRADALASAVEYVSVHGERSVIGPGPVPQEAAPADREKYGIRAAPKRPARGIVKSVNQERFGESRFLGFLKRKIRDWMAPMERFIF